MDQRQGLLWLFATVEPQDVGGGGPLVGPRASDHGPLVFALQINSAVVLFGNCISIYASISSETEPLLLLSGANY